jgi:proteasome lid subunit RPN8/RPN11
LHYERVADKKTDCEKIVSYAKSCLPNECCGLIAGESEGDTRTVGLVYTLTNTDASGTHFTIDAMEHLTTVKDMRTRGIIPLGNFHSHPMTPARPSEEDIKLAYDPSASYVIISLIESEPVMRSFRVENGTLAEEDIEIL